MTTLPRRAYPAPSVLRAAIVATALFLSPVVLTATEVNFTVAEGYASGTLNGQPASGPAWALVSGANSFTVNSPMGLSVNTAQTATQYAVWQTPVNATLTPALTSCLDFDFIQSAATGGTTVITSLTYLYGATSGATNFRAFFARGSGTDAYRIGFYQSNGSPVTSFTLNVPGTALGINSGAGGNASNPLRLTFALNRGASASAWTGTVTLTNLAANTVVGTITIPAFTTSATFYADTALYPAISSEALQSAALSAFTITAYVPPGGTVPPVIPGMTLTFDDEFESASLDQAKWAPHFVGAATINSELEAYTPDSFEFSGTALRIRGDKRAFAGKSYTSGAISTYGRFVQTYGYFEMRAKVNDGRGTWPAFWLLQQNGGWPPEIDVMECLGQDPLTVHQTYHYIDPSLVTAGNPTGKTSTAATTTGPDYSYDYHTYAVSWRPGELIFYLDGVERKRVTQLVSSAPMYLLVNLALGGSWPVAPDFTTQFPNYFDVDYVRAYQYNDLTPVAPMPMAFGRTTVTAGSLAPGDTVTVNTALLVGNAPVTRASIHMYVQGFFGTPQYSDTYQFVDNVPANSSRPLTFSYTIPANFTPGLYTIKFSVSDTTGVVPGTYLGLAARFMVGSPLPALPAPTPPSTAPVINLSALTFANVAGQGTATMTLVNGGTGIRLQGNGWKIAPYTYNVTANTVLEFDVAASTQAEVYGIGLMPADSSTYWPTHTFQLSGGQNIGKQQFKTYSTQTAGVKHYRIPLGGFYTGTMTRLIFINDFDDGLQNGDITFSNLRVYEATP